MARLCFVLLLFAVLHQVSAKTCRRPPEHFNIRCVSETVSVGSDLHCRCVENCRPFTLKCLDSGTFEQIDYFAYCLENQYATEVALTSGRKVRLSFNKRYFEEQCKEGIIRADMADVCDRDGLRENNLPLCDNTCQNPPTELECPRNVYRSTEGYIRCICKQNCLFIRTRCEEGGTFTSCREAYNLEKYYLGDGFDLQETVNATYTPIFFGDASPEIQCPSGQKTINPGKITCINGIAKVLTPPSCETNTSVSALTIALISSAVIAILLLVIIYIFLTKFKKNQMSTPKVEDDEVFYDEIDESKIFPNAAPQLPPPRVHERVHDSEQSKRPLNRRSNVVQQVGYFPSASDRVVDSVRKDTAKPPTKPLPAVPLNNVEQRDVDQEGYLLSTSGRVFDAVRRNPAKPPTKPLPAVPLSNVEQTDDNQGGYILMSASKKFIDGTLATTVPKHSKNVRSNDVNEGGYVNTVSKRKR